MILQSWPRPIASGDVVASLALTEPESRSGPSGLVERIYCDVRLLQLHECTSEVQRLIIGRGVRKAAK